MVISKAGARCTTGAATAGKLAFLSGASLHAEVSHLFNFVIIFKIQIQIEEGRRGSEEV